MLTINGGAICKPLAESKTSKRKPLRTSRDKISWSHKAARSAGDFEAKVNQQLFHNRY